MGELPAPAHAGCFNCSASPAGIIITGSETEELVDSIMVLIPKLKIVIVYKLL